jgi:hypothetical protein
MRSFLFLPELRLPFELVEASSLMIPVARISLTRPRPERNLGII